MKINKYKLTFVFLVLIFNFANAQEKNSIDSLKIDTLSVKKFNYKSIIIPTALMTYGVVGLESDGLKLFNLEIKEEVNENIDKKLTIDDFSQYIPAISVYALNIAGVKGKNNLKDRSIILATSYILVGSSVYGLKTLTKVERPDGSSFNSFPSGHTATAFAGAEFLWQEYKDISVWYGISGYLVATGTGLFRMYNDKHWLTDVAMGAGIGILSTKMAYLIFPYVNKHIFGNNEKNRTAIISPFYNGNQMGLGMILNFK